MTDERANAPGSDVAPPAQQVPYPPYPPPPPYPSYPGGAYPYDSYPGGAPPPPYGGYPAQRPATGPSNGFGIAALVTAIIGLVFVWSVIGGLMLGAVAIILGFVGYGRAKRGAATNGGVAIAGTVLGAIAVVLSLVFVWIWVSLGGRWFEEVGGRDYLSCMQDAGNDQAAQQQCENQFRDRLGDQLGITPTPGR